MARPVKAAGRRPLWRVTADGIWWFAGWPSWPMSLAITDRRADPASLPARMPWATAVVMAGQVHGASVAFVERPMAATQTIAGCDALVTRHPGVALLVRTADCLPLFVADPSRGVVGVAHVGWRGLAARLPLHLLEVLRRIGCADLSALRVLLGPAIRACCYEVGPEFTGRFGQFVRSRGGRRTFDLVGCTAWQLRQGGVLDRRIVDSGCCTACDETWWSLRRDGPTTGRMVSMIVRREAAT